MRRSTLHIALLLLAVSGPLYGRQAPPPDTAKVWTNSLGMRFVRIPAGTFRMGSAGGDPEERPVHEVEITQGFWMGEVEVRQAEWEAAMGAELSRYDGCADCPVAAVSWNDVQDFIQRLNTWEAGRGYRYRLPTEAEWEYACRAGTETAYTFGDDPAGLPEHAWFLDNAELATQPVAQYPPNAWGLYDTHGNVSEWVNDRFDDSYYRASPRRDPQGPERGTQRVFRGGSWNEGGAALRAARRFAGLPGIRYEGVGFRLVRTP